MPEGKGKTLRHAWNRLLKLLRWEKPVVMESPFPPEEVIERIRALLPPTRGWKRFVFFGPVQPLAGELVGFRGLIHSRNRYTSGNVRRLRFSVLPNSTGSELRGRLELIPGLWGYEVLCLGGAIVLELLQIYWMIYGRVGLSGRAFLELLRPFLVIPFLWCYVRFVIWFARKREAELFSILVDVLNRPAAVRPSPVRAVSRSTPTEVFIRPRHRSKTYSPRS